MIYIYYLKRIPAETVQKLSIPELQALVKERMAEKITPIPDEYVIGFGDRGRPLLFGLILLNLIGYCYLRTLF